MTVMANVEQFTDKNVGDVDPDGRDKEVGATVCSVPSQNDNSSPDADDLEKPGKTASRFSDDGFSHCLAAGTY